MNTRSAATVGSLLLAAQAALGQYSFQRLGFLPGEDSSEVTAISGDGQVVVGYSGPHGFQWTRATGMVSLHERLDSNCQAYSVSSDGSVIVGRRGSLAYKWTAATGMVNLPLPPEWSSARAKAVSDGGDVIVGHKGGFSNPISVFRWKESTGSVDLGSLSGKANFPTAVSLDGSVITGFEYTNSDSEMAFRWTETEAFVALGTLSGYPISEALGMTADGSVVVGRSGNFSKGSIHAFRWTQAKGMEDLGPGEARDITPDGSMIVGFAKSKYGAYWTERIGWVSLGEELRAHGIEVNDWDISLIHAVSDDQRTFVGSSEFEGWIATIAGPCYPDCDVQGGLDIDDFICFQTKYFQGSPYADCDNSGELDIDDFICFQTQFAVGCE